MITAIARPIAPYCFRNVTNSLSTCVSSWLESKKCVSWGKKDVRASLTLCAYQRSLTATAPDVTAVASRNTG